jgi:ankyrin repeat protein
MSGTTSYTYTGRPSTGYSVTLTAPLGEDPPLEETPLIDAEKLRETRTAQYLSSFPSDDPRHSQPRPVAETCADRERRWSKRRAPAEVAADTSDAGVLRAALNRWPSNRNPNPPRELNNAGDLTADDEFLAACARGEVDRMQTLRDAGCDVKKAKLSDGQTGAMLAAACEGGAAALRWLLDPVPGALEPVELEARTDRGSTAFYHACLAGQLECMKMLHEAGCEVNGSFVEGQSCLMAVAYYNHPLAMRWLLNECGADLEALDDHGGTPYFHACAGGHVECMKMLREAGCERKTAHKRNDNQSELMAAISSCKGWPFPSLASGKGHPAALQYLMDECEEHGDLQQELEERDMSGGTPFLYASKFGEVECMKILKEAGSDVAALAKGGQSGLVCAASDGQSAAIRWLLDECGADLEVVSDYGTAFVMASSYGHIECMQMLKDAGCDVKARNTARQTNLQIAAAKGQTATVHWLLDECGAELEEIDPGGATAFLFACDFGQEETLKVLKEAGCNVKARTRDGRTGLMMAARSNDRNGEYNTEAALRWLLDEGEADLESYSFREGTAFLVAATFGKIEAMKILKEYGCNLKAKTSDNGRNALMLAACEGHVAAVQWLLDEARPRLEQRDDDGGTAFLIAVSFGRLEIMRQENAYLLRHFNSPFYPDRLGTKYRESTQHEMMRFLTGCWRRQGATAML